MKPSDYKQKQFLYLSSNTKFTCIGGGKKDGNWYLKDANGNSYPLDRCVEIEQLEFDLRRLKAVNSRRLLDEYYENRGHDRFSIAWDELQKEPVEAAAVAILYCDDWESFSSMCDAYGVSKVKSPDLNQRFRVLLKGKGLDHLPIQWHKNYKPPEITELDGISVGDRVVCSEYSDRIGEVFEIDPRSEITPYKIFIEGVAVFGTDKSQIELEF